MTDVRVQRRALLRLEFTGAVECRDVNRRAIQRRTDVARQERAVVVAVVPREAALIVRVLPELLHEGERLDRLLRVDRHLALGVAFLAAIGPKQRIREGRRVAEGVAKRLADGALRGLQLLADLVVLLPGLR